MTESTRPLGVVVTSIGRRAALERLVRSLAGQPVLLAVALQGGDPDLPADLDRLCADLGVDAVVGLSGGGASRGRNDAASWITGRVDLLSFPNDTTVFPARTAARMLEGMQTAGCSAGAVTVTDPTGPKFTLPPAGTALTQRNAWDVILPGMLMSAEVFAAIGGFDETLGTGAATPWQSGEETELLLRHRDRRGAGFAWLGAIEVHNPHDTAGLDPRHRRRKLRGYARGYGRVLRTCGYGGRGLVRGLVAGVTFGLRHGAPYSLLDGAAVAIGRAEGFVGVVVGDRGRTALREAPAVAAQRPSAVPVAQD